MKKNYKKNFIWNIIGLSFYSFVSLFLLIVVKRVNGLNIAGIFTYAFSLSTLFLYISLYFNRVYQIANYDNNKTFNQFFITRLLTSLLSLLIIVVFSLINDFNLYKIEIIVLLMLFRICDALSETFYGYEQDKDYLYKVGVSYTLKSLIGFILFTIVDICTKSLLFSCLVLTLTCFVFLFVYDLNNYKKLSKNKKIQFDTSNIKLIIREAFPIFAFSFLSIYLANSQKYILDYFVSYDIQTIFGILIMPATVLSLVGSYIIMPFIGKINELYKNKQNSNLFKLCNKLIFLLFLIGIIVLLICYFIGIPVLNIVYNIDLWKYRIQLEIIIFGSIFFALSMIISNMMIIFNDNKSQIIIYLIGSIISTLLSVYLIKNFEINGAIVSYAISYLIIFMMYIFRYFYNFNMMKKEVIK